MLEEYKDILASLAGILTIGQMFSGLFILRDIYRQGSTKNVPSTPFIGGVAISVLFMEHGRLLGDAALGVVNFVGIAINIAYLAFFIFWSGAEERGEMRKPFAVSSAIVAVLIGYARIENEEVVAFRFGTIVTAMLFLLIASPLFSIRTIIKEKNTDVIPLPMVLSGFFVGISWMLYGVAANQTFIVYQNIIGVSLSAIQLVLCAMYPGKKVKQQ